jgi:flagellar assembly protein FliH
VPNDRRKYLFDLNNFDSKEEREIDPDLPPPPPVFNLDDMGAAEQEGYLKGREEALEEARVSREQYIASQISGLNDQIKSLFLAEQIREKHFEEEAVHLVTSLFSKTFPSFSAKHSLDEIIQIIRQVISTQEQTSIVIDVPQADLDDISAQISLLLESSQGRLSLVGADDLGAGSCRLSWKNGGAVRDQTALVELLTREIEDVLAPKAQKSQNNESEENIDTMITGSETGTQDEGEDQ